MSSNDKVHHMFEYNNFIVCVTLTNATMSITYEHNTFPGVRLKINGTNDTVDNLHEITNTCKLFLDLMGLQLKRDLEIAWKQRNQ
jgi:hypothetical protein